LLFLSPKQPEIRIKTIITNLTIYHCSEVKINWNNGASKTDSDGEVNHMHVKLMISSCLFKKYLKFLNRLYDITWFGAVYVYASITCSKFQIFLIIQFLQQNLMIPQF